MATPNIVPRADSEGGLGTASKYWASAYIDTITTTSHVNLPDNAELRLGTGNDLKIKHNGTNSEIYNVTGNLIIHNANGDSDIIFKGSDGGSEITALTLDMSNAGTATFNGAVIADTHFNSSDSNVTLSTNSDGTVHLRPNGIASTTAQSTFTTSLATIGTNATFTGTVAATSYNGIPFFSDVANGSMYTHDVSGTDNTAQFNTAYGFAAMDAITMLLQQEIQM